MKLDQSSDNAAETHNVVDKSAQDEQVVANPARAKREYKKPKKKLKFYETWKFIIFVCLVLPLTVRSLAVAPFHIPSDSMKSTLLVGDFLFVDKSSYGYSRYSFPLGINFFDGRIGYKEPKLGDVVVFRPPPTPHVDYIKRIVGMPGDRVQMRNGELHLNGKKVKRKKIEDFVDITKNGDHIRMDRYIETLPNGVSYETLDMHVWRLDNTKEFVVPEGHFFMMGDNRDNSSDSRVKNVVGFVPAENLVGRAERIFVSTSDSLLKFWTWFDAIRSERFWMKIR